MAVPKKRTTKSKRGMRRSHIKKVVSISTCNNCGSCKVPHHICPMCKFYKGKKTIL